MSEQKEQQAQSEELKAEQLGKIAGGFNPVGGVTDGLTNEELDKVAGGYSPITIRK